MAHYTDKTEHVAVRKTHKCYWCGQRVEIGEKYARWRSYAYGDAATIITHKDCCDAWMDEADAEGGYYETGYACHDRPEAIAPTPERQP